MAIEPADNLRADPTWTSYWLRIPTSSSRSSATTPSSEAPQPDKATILAKPRISFTSIYPLRTIGQDVIHTHKEVSSRSHGHFNRRSGGTSVS